MNSKFPSQLKPLLQYTSEEWQAAESYSPALKRYRPWLKDDQADPNSQLRGLRNEMWMTSALATLTRSASDADICSDWSRVADFILRESWDQFGLSKIPSVLFAMGKLGAQELNLSSDVDLILVSPSRHIPELTQALKKWNVFLTSLTDRGFIFRTDFDLRPGGRRAPLITALEEIEVFYASLGQTWERLAWLRARPIAGSEDVGQQVLSFMTRFCFRKYIDLSLLKDLQAIRQKIGRHYWLEQNGIDLKMSVGGIRDIELFVQSLLLIHGGRLPQLRTHKTSHLIELLQNHDLLSKDDACMLSRAYWTWRHFENLVQIQSDSQTHILHTQNMFYEEAASKWREWAPEVDHIITALLGRITETKHSLPRTEEGLTELFGSLGFSAKDVMPIWDDLVSATRHHTVNEEQFERRENFLRIMLEEVSKTSVDPLMALSQIVHFIRAIRSKDGLFLLVNSEPRLARDLAQIFGVSPYLGSILSSRPELIDSFLLKRDELLTGDEGEFLEGLVEHRLLSEILVGIELINQKNITKAGQGLSDAADLIVSSLMQFLEQTLNITGVEVLAMGKWGGKELGFRSDLDLILVTKDSPSHEQMQLAKRLISRLTDMHRGGRIYEVDLRLRPSGAAGPLLISKDSLTEHLKEKALGWSRQAFLRSRLIGGDGSSLRSAALHRGLSPDEISELKAIRQKLLKPVPQDLPHLLDLKLVPGGLIDIEFTAQLSLLKHRINCGPTDTIGMITTLAQSDRAWADSSQELIAAYEWIRLLEQVLQLASTHSGAQPFANRDTHSRLATIFKMTATQILEAALAQIAKSQTLLSSLDPLT